MKIEGKENIGEKVGNESIKHREGQSRIQKASNGTGERQVEWERDQTPRRIHESVV